MSIKIKQELYIKCLEYVNSKLENIRVAIEEAQTAAEEASRSSVDEEEAGSAVLHLQQEKFDLQIAETMKLKNFLEQLDVSKELKIVQTGSLIKTDQGNYFFAFNAGEFEIQGEKYFTVSIVSPIGQAFVNKKVGEKVNFRNKIFQIKSII